MHSGAASANVSDRVHFILFLFLSTRKDLRVVVMVFLSLVAFKETSTKKSKASTEEALLD